MQRIKNYGSFLQAYALKSMIEELGHKVEFVDYRIGKVLIEDESSNSKFTKAIGVLKGDAPLIQKMQYIIHKKNLNFALCSKASCTRSEVLKQVLYLTRLRCFCSQKKTNLLGGAEK